MSFAEGGGGEPAIISCEQADSGLICSRNTTVVDNATEIVEIRLQVDRSSLETTEISVPGYRLIIDIPETEGVVNSLAGAMGVDSLGVGGIILGNLAAMALLLLFCGLIGAFVGQRNKKKIEEVQGMVNQGMEMAGIAPPEDEDALYISETGDGETTLDKKSLAASAANSWRQSTKDRKGRQQGGKKTAMLSVPLYPGKAL